MAHVAGGLALGFLPFDDTFITFRYAQNLALGHGLVFNWNERVLGTTTPLWTIYLAASYPMGISIVHFAVCSSLLFDVCTAYLLARLIESLNLGRVTGYVGGILLLAHVDYLALGLSGMETSLFTFLIVASLYAISSESAVLSGMLIGLAGLTRPEAVFLLPVLLLDFFLRKPRNWASLAKTSLVALLGAVPWFIFATWYFGGPVSQSVIAKFHTFRTPDAEATRFFVYNNVMQFFIHGQWGLGLLRRTYLAAQIIISGFAALGANHLTREAFSHGRKERRAVVALMTFPILYVSALTAAGAFTVYAWYYGPIYPFLTALAAVGVAATAAIVFSSPRATRFAHASFLAVVALCQIVALSYFKIPKEHQNFWIEGWTRLAQCLPKNSRITIASEEIGVVGWLAYPIHVVDLHGLVTPRIDIDSQLKAVESMRPEYLANRSEFPTDLNSEAGQTWISQNYDEVARIEDPYQPPEHPNIFLLYRLKKAGGLVAEQVQRSVRSR